VDAREQPAVAPFDGICGQSLGKPTAQHLALPLERKQRAVDQRRV